MMQNAAKYLQRRLYSFLNTWWGFSLFLLLCFLLLHTIINHWHGDSIALSRHDYSQQAHFYDNIGGIDVQSLVAFGPIDAVYTWVNGSDPVWAAKKQYYAELLHNSHGNDKVGLPPVANHTTNNSSFNYHLEYTNISTLLDAVANGNETVAFFFNCSSSGPCGNDSSLNNDKTGNSTVERQEEEGERDDTMSQNRYRDSSELRYSLRSLVKNAPWIRHIYLVTDNQIPNWLNIDTGKLTVVSHRDIFLNESHLPVFSSPAIEAHLHRIPGLSQKFIYFNDDVFLGSPVTPDDFINLNGVQRLVMAWDVPKCAPGCSDSWIGDGFCDKACNVSSCNFDFPDCINGTNVHGSNGYGSGRGSSRHHSSATYCSTGCPDAWLADKVCDQRCNNRACGWDVGDCGIDQLTDQFPGVEISSYNALIGFTGHEVNDAAGLDTVGSQHGIDEAFNPDNYLADYMYGGGYRMEDDYVSLHPHQYQQHFNDDARQDYDPDAHFHSINDDYYHMPTMYQGQQQVKPADDVVGNEGRVNDTENTIGAHNPDDQLHHRALSETEGMLSNTTFPNALDSTATINTSVSNGNDSMRADNESAIVMSENNESAVAVPKNNHRADFEAALTVEYGTEAVYFDLASLFCYYNSSSSRLFEEPNRRQLVLPASVLGCQPEHEPSIFYYRSAEHDNEQGNLIHSATILSRHHVLVALLLHGQKGAPSVPQLPMLVTFTVIGEHIPTGQTVTAVFSLQIVERVEREQWPMLKPQDINDLQETYCSSNFLHHNNADWQGFILRSSEVLQTPFEYRLAATLPSAVEAMLPQTFEMKKGGDELRGAVFDVFIAGDSMQTASSICDIFVKLTVSTDPSSEWKYAASVCDLLVGFDNVTNYYQYSLLDNVRVSANQSTPQTHLHIAHEEWIKFAAFRKKHQEVEIPKSPRFKQSVDDSSSNGSMAADIHFLLLHPLPPLLNSSNVLVHSTVHFVVTTRDAAAGRSFMSRQWYRRLVSFHNSSSANVSEHTFSVGEHADGLEVYCDAHSSGCHQLSDRIGLISTVFRWKSNSTNVEAPNSSNRNYSLSDHSVVIGHEGRRRLGNLYFYLIWSDIIQSVDSLTTQSYRWLLRALPWMYDGEINSQQVSLKRNESSEMMRRRLADTYAASLIRVNRMYSKAFGNENRKVPAHLPHMIDKTVVEEMQQRWPEEWNLTSRNKFRSETDMQYSFSYYHYLANRWKVRKPDVSVYVRSVVDSDKNGFVDSNEFLTLVALARGSQYQPTEDDITQLYNCVVANSSFTPTFSDEVKHRLPHGMLRQRYSVDLFPSIEQVLNCSEIFDGIEKNVDWSIRFPTHVFDTDKDLVAFEMVGDNYNDTLNQLNSVRARQSKFVCINDNMREPTKELEDVLHNFYESFFPEPSQFELPSGAENPTLYLDQYLHIRRVQRQKEEERGWLMKLIERLSNEIERLYYSTLDVLRMCAVDTALFVLRLASTNEQKSQLHTNEPVTGGNSYYFIHMHSDGSAGSTVHGNGLSLPQQRSEERDRASWHVMLLLTTVGLVAMLLLRRTILLNRRRRNQSTVGPAAESPVNEHSD